MDFDETSEEAVTTISMIKNMTSTQRRLSGLKPSSVLPLRSSPNRFDARRGSPRPLSNHEKFCVKPTKVSNPSWPSIGVTLASKEFKRGLERKKLRQSKSEMIVDDSNTRIIPRSTDFPQRDNARLAVLKSILSKEGDATYKSADTVPEKFSSASKNSRKTPHPTFPAAKEGTFYPLPLLSVVKINPIHRQAFLPKSKVTPCQMKYFTDAGPPRRLPTRHSSVYDLRQMKQE